jgi:alcohol dehydrogenase
VFIEPLAAALQTFAMTPLPDKALVAVLGCGRLGALVAMVAKGLGAKTLAFTDRQDDVENASAIGVEAQKVMATEQIVEAVKDATGGLGADVVVEATGSPDGLSVALDCVRPRGTIALKSTPGTPVEQFDLTRVVVDEIRLQGSRCGDFARAIAFWKGHRPPLSRLIRSQFPLDRIDEAIAKAHGPGKVLVRCGD